MTAPLLPPPIPTGNTRRVLTTLRDGSVVAARRGGRIAGRTLKWTLIAIGVLVTLIAAFVIYVAVVGVSVDAAPLRGRIAEAFTKALGRTVDFDGPAQLEISARPKLRIGGLRIANPPGFGGDTFASLGEARLALDLWPLLRKRLRVYELAGSDVKVRLEMRADGRNNWTFTLARADTPKAAPSTDGTDLGDLPVVDVRDISLDRLAVEYVTREGRSHFFDLKTLRGQSPAGQPFRMALDGTVEKTFPYHVEFKGGPLSDLTEPEKPWPVEMMLTFLGTTLRLEGAAGTTGGEIRFALGADRLTDLERLLQTELPKVGAVGLVGTVRYTPTQVSVEPLTVVTGRTTAYGHLRVDQSGPKPRIDGALDVPALDLRPFLLDKPDDDDEPPRSLADTYRELSQATFSLRSLQRADVDLTLKVDRWLSLPGDVRDAQLHVKLVDGKLDLPIAAQVTGVNLAGGMQVDATVEPPRFGLRLATQDSDLGGLAELFAGAKGIAGHLGSLQLDLAAVGDRGSELVQTLDVKLDVRKGRFTYGNVEGGRPVEFTLDRYTVELPAGRNLTGRLDGTLLDQPLHATLASGTLDTMIREGRGPVNLQARSRDLKVSLLGVVEAPTADAGPDFRFDISAPKAATVARWLGLKRDAVAAIRVQGRARLTESAWRLDDFRFDLGRTRIAAAASQTGLGSGKPLLAVKLVAERLDVDELRRLVPPSTNDKQADAKPVLEVPILPNDIDLSDTDITVRVGRVDGGIFGTRDIAFDGRIRDGYMGPSTFAATVADVPFRGALSLDLRGNEPSAGIWLAATDADVGRVLHRLSLAPSVDAVIGSLRLQLIARASLLGDMLERSELIGNVEGGRISIRDAGSGAQAKIDLDSGELRALKGAPIQLTLQGRLDEEPVAIVLETGRPHQLVDPNARIPFKLEAAAAGTSVKLAGSLDRDIDDRDVELAIDARGTRFDELDKLARASLPPWGPWSATGNFKMSKTGYAVSGLRLQVGSSVLHGKGALNTAATPPRIDVTLAAPNIQLDDFAFGDWSPTPKKTEAPKPATDEDLRRKATDASNQAQKLLSPAVLRRQNAFLSVKVDQVLSGRDRLGGGSLDAKLDNGRADIGPVVVDVPGGGAKLWLGYEPTDRDVKVDLKMRVNRFDYGVLARRFKPEADLKGTFSLKIDVDSRAPYLADLLKHGNGRIDFAVFPQDMQSGIIDLWAVNLLVALAPAVDKSAAPKVNCAVGRFVLKDGKLTDRTIVMDTTRMRVTGQGEADFDSERLSLRMRPQAKTPQFLSLATPVAVSGSFGDPKIGVGAGDILGTIGRLATSIFWVPIQKLVAKPVPADGSDVCGNPLADATD